MNGMNAMMLLIIASIKENHSIMEQPFVRSSDLVRDAVQVVRRIFHQRFLLIFKYPL